MSKETIVYFCNRYLVMLNFYETLGEVISDFLGKEEYESAQRLKKECMAIMKLKNEEKELKIREILSKVQYINIEVDEMEEILNDIILKI